MRRTRLAATSVLAASALLAGATTASAQTASGTSDSTVNATLTDAALTGTRTIAVGTPIALAQLSVNGAAVAALDGTLTITVEEVAMAGANPWYVTAKMSKPMTSTTLATPTTIPNANLSVAGCSTLTDTGSLLGSSLTKTTLAAPADLSQEREVFRIAEQDIGTLYSNVYTCTSSLGLDLPAELQPDAYTGTLTATLWQ